MNKEKILQNRFIKLLGPRVTDPQLWEWSKHNVALGSAIGVSFGLLVPLAQIPLSVMACILLRANILAASVTTLISNPITFAPLYYGAYKFGSLVLGREVIESTMNAGTELNGSLWLMDVGKPLYLGLGLFTIPAAVSVYLLVRLLWSKIEKKRAIGNG